MLQMTSVRGTLIALCVCVCLLMHVHSCPLIVEEVCRELYEELKSEVTADSGSYIQYMEANEEQDK